MAAKSHIWCQSVMMCQKNPTTTKKKDNHGCNTYVTCHFPKFQRLCWRSKICFYSPTRPEHPQRSESASKRQLESCKLNFGNGIYVRKIHWESVGPGNWKPDNWWANIVEAGGDDMQAGNDYAVIPGQSGTLRGGALKSKRVQLRRYVEVVTSWRVIQKLLNRIISNLAQL